MVGVVFIMICFFVDDIGIDVIFLFWVDLVFFSFW